MNSKIYLTSPRCDQIGANTVLESIMFHGFGEVLNLIHEAEESIRPTGEKHDFFYRGQADSGWRLLPEIYRGEGIDEDSEKNMFVHFCMEYKRFKNEDDTWNLAFAMRHHGLPTRLLDWTSSLGAALFFSVYDKNAPSPCIWILNPYKINYQSIGDGNIAPTFFKNRNDFNYIDLIAGGASSQIVLPVAISPSASNERIIAQKGFFTVHTKNRNPIDELFPDFCRKVIIPSTLVQVVRDVLSKMGINYYSLFPDVDGLSIEISNQYITNRR